MDSLKGSFERFRAFLQNASGIVLGADQRWLVNARLAPLLKEQGIDSLDVLVEQLEQRPFCRLRTQVLDAMCTNETLWFRDGHPFDTLKDSLLPERLAAARCGPLRIWSAAASSGQEPYSIAMLVDEFEQSQPQLFKSAVEILGTELSSSMLAACERAEYDNLAIRRGLSAARLERYFKRLDGGRWQVKAEIRQRVTFQSQNLLSSFACLGQFDIVFCRNVLIYFTQAQRDNIIKRIHGCLKPGGYLLLGATEALGGLSTHFQTIRCRQSIVYQAK